MDVVANTRHLDVAVMVGQLLQMNHVYAIAMRLDMVVVKMVFKKLKVKITQAAWIFQEQEKFAFSRKIKVPVAISPSNGSLILNMEIVHGFGMAGVMETTIVSRHKMTAEKHAWNHPEKWPVSCQK